MKLAVASHCRTIAFPNISTGVYHFPKEKAAHIAVRTVLEFLQKEMSISKVIFVCFDAENESLIRKEIDQTR